MDKLIITNNIKYPRKLINKDYVINPQLKKLTDSIKQPLYFDDIRPNIMIINSNRIL